MPVTNDCFEAPFPSSSFHPGTHKGKESETNGCFSVALHDCPDCHVLKCTENVGNAASSVDGFSFTSIISESRWFWCFIVLVIDTYLGSRDRMIIQLGNVIVFDSPAIATPTRKFRPMKSLV